MSKQKLTKLEQKSFAAMDSTDPFQSPPTRPMRLVDPSSPKRPEPPQELMEALAQVAQPATAAPVVEAPSAPAPAPAPVTEQSFEVTETHSEYDGPRYESNWRGREVMIAIPIYKSINPGTSIATTAMVADLGLDKVRLEYEFSGAYIDVARANIAAKFLDSGAKWLFMMDDDIFPAFGRPAAMRNIARLPNTVSDDVLRRSVLPRLLSTNQKLVGAAYFGRFPNAPLMAASAELYTQAAKNHHQGVFPVDWVGGGCILIHRDVFLGIKAAFPELSSGPSAPFPFFRRNGEFSEDISFCQRAKKAGFQPYLDTSTPVYHYGGHFYGGGTL